MAPPPDPPAPPVPLELPPPGPLDVLAVPLEAVLVHAGSEGSFPQLAAPEPDAAPSDRSSLQLEQSAPRRAQPETRSGARLNVRRRMLSPVAQQSISRRRVASGDPGETAREREGLLAAPRSAKLGA